VSARRVAVVGAGASGTLQAVHLARRGVEVALIDRGPAPGRGVAYGTARPEHLLNVPARRMSAFPDDPSHFTRWWGGSDEGFAPRMVYGDYLRELLNESGVEPIIGEAVSVGKSGESERVGLADGRAIDAGAVVLAPGNLRPAVPGRFDIAALGAAWVGDPWASDWTREIGRDDMILLIGTGLTAVDVALTLEARGFAGRILALSRRGLAPRAHGAHEPMTVAAEPLPVECIGLLRHVRCRTDEVGWRSAVHELRTVTQDVWRAAAPEQRRRFLRHLRPWWDVHRHRVAPDVGATIARMQEDGRLAFCAGRITTIEPHEGCARIAWQARGGGDIETIDAARVVNCTGPELDIVRAGEPLFDALLAAGRIRPDPCRIGLDVDWDLRTLDARGQASDTLFALGPVTRGTFWESVAVPDIRDQSARLAERLSA